PSDRAIAAAVYESRPPLRSTTAFMAFTRLACPAARPPCGAESEAARAHDPEASTRKAPSDPERRAPAKRGWRERGRTNRSGRLRRGRIHSLRDRESRT